MTRRSTIPPEGDNEDGHGGEDGSIGWSWAVVRITDGVMSVVQCPSPEAFRRLLRIIRLALLGLVLAIVLVAVARFPLDVVLHEVHYIFRDFDEFTRPY